MKFCAFCGAKLEDDAVFCHVCGEKCIEFFDEGEPEPSEEELALAKKQEEKRLAKEEAERLERERLEREEAERKEQERLAEEARLAEIARQEEEARLAEEKAKQDEIDRLVEERVAKERERIREEERAKYVSNIENKPTEVNSSLILEEPPEEKIIETKRGGFLLPIIFAILAIGCGFIYLFFKGQPFAIGLIIAGPIMVVAGLIFSIITLVSKKRSSAAKTICLSMLIVFIGITVFLIMCCILKMPGGLM